MSDSSPTLFDLLTMFPDLDPSILTSTNITTIRDLRLVSREIGDLALTAVQSCTVHFGEGKNSPSPQQLVKLMAGAELHRLDVIITVMTGEEDMA